MENECNCSSQETRSRGGRQRKISTSAVGSPHHSPSLKGHWSGYWSGYHLYRSGSSEKAVMIQSSDIQLLKLNHYGYHLFSTLQNAMFASANSPQSCGCPLPTPPRIMIAAQHAVTRLCNQSWWTNHTYNRAPMVDYKANVIKFIVSCLPPAWYFDPASFFLLSIYFFLAAAMASFFKRSVVVSQSKAIVPWTVIQLDDDSTFEELFNKIKVRTRAYILLRRRGHATPIVTVQMSKFFSVTKNSNIAQVRTRACQCCL